MGWDEVAKGDGCPFDAPRAESNEFWDTVAKLKVSTLCLLKNQAYRGQCLLIYDPRHVIRPDQLDENEWGMYAQDVHEATRALMGACRPDHINLAMLGNEMPHLHWHLIPRYKSDPRWGGPIWTTKKEELHRAELPENERVELIRKLRAYLRNLEG